MLLNDDKFIKHPAHGPLRRAMLLLYGLNESPASDVMKSWIESTTPAEFKPEEAAVEVKGTDGWKWRVTDINPLVDGFTIYFKKKNQRKWTKVVQDSSQFEYCYHYDDVLSLVELLSDSPRVLIQDGCMHRMSTSCDRLPSITLQLRSDLRTMLRSEQHLELAAPPRFEHGSQPPQGRRISKLPQGAGVIVPPDDLI